MNLANTVSIIRIALVPVVIVLYFAEFSGHYLWAALIFGVASFSDWLDGYFKSFARTDASPAGGDLLCAWLEKADPEVLLTGIERVAIWDRLLSSNEVFRLSNPPKGTLICIQ